AQELHFFIGPGHSSPPRSGSEMILNAVEERRRSMTPPPCLNHESPHHRKTGVVQRCTHQDGSAARDVVLDKQNATLLLESSARVAKLNPPFSTTACPPGCSRPEIR